jgi:hypothetical protein
MADGSWRIKLRMPNSPIQEIDIKATNYIAAQHIAESQYGKGNIISIKWVSANDIANEARKSSGFNYDKVESIFSVFGKGASNKSSQSGERYEIDEDHTEYDDQEDEIDGFDDIVENNEDIDGADGELQKQNYRINTLKVLSRLLSKDIVDELEFSELKSSILSRP